MFSNTNFTTHRHLTGKHSESCVSTSVWIRDAEHFKKTMMMLSSTAAAITTLMATLIILLLLTAPTWLWGRCGDTFSPASSVIGFIFRRSDGSHVSVDTVHPSLLRSSSFSSPRWSHLQSLSSDVFLVSPLDVAKLPQSCFPAPLCGVLYLQCLPDVTVSHMVSYNVWPPAHLHIFISVTSRFFTWELVTGTVSIPYIIVG